MKNQTTTGRVWKFGDNVDTDSIISGKYLDAPIDEIVRYVFENVRPEFSISFEPGDVIIGGGNFGCGSSREQAPAALKKMGAGCVIAESFGRIFFRNAIAIGLPILYCKNASTLFQEGDVVTVQTTGTAIVVCNNGKKIDTGRLSPEMLDIITAGGILKLLKKQMSASH